MTRAPVGWFVALGLLAATAVLLTRQVGGPALLVGTVLLGPWVLWWSIRFPRRALRAGFFLVLIAGTKFRVRDPWASVETSIDAQIAFELMLYAFVAWVTLREMAALPRRVWHLTWLETLLFGYTVLAVASAVWSPIPSYTLVRSMQLVVLLGYSLTLTRTLGATRTWMTLGSSIVAYTALFAVLGAVGTATGLFQPLHSRFSWFGVHPIQAGSNAALAALILLSPLLFGWRRSTSPGLRRLGVAGFVLILLLTQSRGPLFAFAVAVASLLMIRGLRRGAATLGVVTTTTVGLLLLNIPGGFVGVVDDILGLGTPWVEALARGQTPEELLSMTGRVGLWAALFPAFLDHPIIGHGYQVGRIVGMEIAPWAGEAHNAAIQSLIDLGVTGTTLLLVPLIGVLIVAYHRLVEAPPDSTSAALIASQFAAILFLFINSVGTAGFAGVPGFETLLLFTAAAVSNAARTPEPNPDDRSSFDDAVSRSQLPATARS